MTTPTLPTAAAAPQPGQRSAGIVLTVLGLAGHLYAAAAIGGSRTAYTHHVVGFGLILVVTGAIIAFVSRDFWRARPERIVLVIGIVQALVGLLIAMSPSRVVIHGG